ncbi:hypothetical protein NXS19_002030, partial [Fusarium pseudograminearum]
MDNLDMPPAPTPPANNNASNTDRTANLLNLLKFSGSGGSQLQSQAAQARAHGHNPQQQQQQQPVQQPQELQQQEHSPQQRHQQMSPDMHQFNQFQQHAQQGRGIIQSPLPAQIHQPSPSSADPTGLLAALMRGANEPEEQKHQQQQAHPQQPFGNGSPPADTRSYLLNLLNRPKPSQGDQQHSILSEGSRSTNLTPQSPGKCAPETARYSGVFQQQYGQHQHSHSGQFSNHQHRQTDSYAGSHAPSNASDSYYPSQESQADASALFQQLLGNLAQSSPQSQSHGHAAQSPSGLPFQILKKDSPAASHHSHHSHHSHRHDHSVGAG